MHADTCHIKIPYSTCITQVEIIIDLDVFNSIATYFKRWLAIKIRLKCPFISVCQIGFSGISEILWVFSFWFSFFLDFCKLCHFTAISSDIVTITATPELPKAESIKILLNVEQKNVLFVFSGTLTNNAYKCNWLLIY